MEIKRRKIATTSKADKITAKNPKKNDKISTKAAKEEEIITVSAPKDWKTEEKSKQEDAKKKAAEVMKKLRGTGSTSKKTRRKE